MFDQIKTMLSGLLNNSSSQAWWVEVKTAQPECTYYFGPFDDSNEAANARTGYIEDLQSEGAEQVDAVVKRCQPTSLTISKE